MRGPNSDHRCGETHPRMLVHSCYRLIIASISYPQQQGSTGFFFLNNKERTHHSYAACLICDRRYAKSVIVDTTLTE